MESVVKRSGVREPFSPDKLRKAIEKAAIDAGLGARRRAEVVERVSTGVFKGLAKKAEIASSALRDEVLGRLDKVEASVSAAWRRFDQRYKKR